MEEYAKLVATARSVRRFDQSVAIDRATLEKLVDMARICPSAANRQPLRYRLVYTRNECDKIFPATAWAGAIKEWKGPEEGQRPTAYIIMMYENGGTPPDLDAGIAGQTIQLGACSMGYGCCMLGALNRDNIQQTLNIPEKYAIIMALALGKPAETVVLEEAAASDDLKYWRDAESVHHVPKRKLENIVIE